MQEGRHSTGIAGLDRVLNGILPGDNIVWKVDSIEDYVAFAIPYAEEARAAGRKLVYFRFAGHGQLLPDDFGADIHRLDPRTGFEQFISGIHRIIEANGRGAYYLFDCLSDLVGDWYSDQMLGNFFMLTCPFLYDLETVTYFAILRDRHSEQAVGPISETTQLLIEVLRHKSALYVRPVKVQHRYSPTMNMLHVWRGEEFTPVSSSAVLSEIQTSMQWSGLGDGIPGPWERAFAAARSALENVKSGAGDPAGEAPHLRRLLSMMIARQGEILDLVGKYLSLDDVVGIGKRMIGTGLIGGKAVGMLLARAILRQGNRRFETVLEAHDSFYVGSDVFYTFLVQNGIWWIRAKQRNPETFLQDAEQARRRILTGKFPEHVMAQFNLMLDYFGQAPFIVRSSSLLEDNFGNSFAGKYESVFCANQGPHARRLENFLSAVRTVYAGTMSEKALRYREQRGILDHDEQMALLVMRVSGERHGRFFFPAVAGVGFSFNPYVWSEKIDPKAGVVRLVFGLGTRAVDRADDDYTRVVALNAPDRRPESDFDAVARYAQRRVDCLDLEANQLVSESFDALRSSCGDLPIDLFVSPDMARNERASSRPGGGPGGHVLLTCDNLLDNTGFVEDLREALRTLEMSYRHPVDIEFSANFSKDNSYTINLLQCRPLQVKDTGAVELPPVSVAEADIVLRSNGPVIGRSRSLEIDRFVYVVPSVYGAMPLRERHEVAGVIGRVNRAIGAGKTIMLMGPGRWGTSTPSLGVPVSFADINRVSVLCEIVAMREDVIPDVSLGTHFFNELVEQDMLYLAFCPDREDSLLREDLLEGSRSMLAGLIPDAARWAGVLKVIEPSAAFPGGARALIRADAIKQEALCYMARIVDEGERTS